MGKKRLEKIKEKFPDTPFVQSNSKDAQFEYERAQKIVSKSKRYQTRALCHMRKGMKRFKKEMGRGQAKYAKIHGEVLMFGYWKYWLMEGKIGPDE